MLNYLFPGYVSYDVFILYFLSPSLLYICSDLVQIEILILIMGVIAVYPVLWLLTEIPIDSYWLWLNGFKVVEGIR